MSAFLVTIKTDNAAFEELEFELARILRSVASKIESGKLQGIIMDGNGNRVGNYMQEPD